MKDEDRRKWMRDQAGFTLLELTLVLLVLGLAATLTYPALSRGSASLNLRGAGRDVLNTMRYAREISITRQVGMRITVEAEQRRIVLSNDIGEGARSYGLPTGVSIRHVRVGGEEILGRAALIRFLPNGSSDRAEVTLQSSSGLLLHVVTDPITGGARLVRPGE